MMWLLLRGNLLGHLAYLTLLNGHLLKPTN
jgi:hypothetical protein